MHRVLALVMAAGGLFGTGAVAQTVAPPPPPPMQHGGGLMRADANHDGTVTRAEMIADADMRFAAMDTDKDGKVTAAERDAAREAMRAQRSGGAAGGQGGGPRGGGGFGMRGDPDGDHVLTRAEAVQRAGTRFDRLDTNHDGKLDAAEIAAGRPMRGARQAGAMPPPPAATSPQPQAQ